MEREGEDVSSADGMSELCAQRLSLWTGVVVTFLLRLL